MGLPLSALANPITDSPANTDEGANQILEGVFSGVGPSRPIPVYGAFNFNLFGSVSYTIHFQAGSAVTTVTNGALMAAGQSVVATGLPPGATIASLSTVQVSGLTTVTIGGLSTAQIGTITAGAIVGVFVGAGVTPTATINLERTFDGGYTWIPAGIGNAGQPATYQFGSAAIDNPLSAVGAEPEVHVGYRFNCTAFSGAVNVNYRLSISGLAAMAWGIPSN